MKKVLLLILICCLPICFYGQKEKKVKRQSIVCEVTYFSKETLPYKKSKWHCISVSHGKGQLYACEGADVFLIQGTDTLSIRQSDFEGEVFFKKVDPGEYIVIAKHAGFNQAKSKVVVADKLAEAKLTLFPIEK